MVSRRPWIGEEYGVCSNSRNNITGQPRQLPVKLMRSGHESSFGIPAAPSFCFTQKRQCSDAFFEHENKGHGRHERRCCWVFDDLSVLSTAGEWAGIQQFGVIQSDRTIDGKASTALRFYISSKAVTAEDMLNATRQHWEVENNLHWMLDVAFNEDACQTKDECAAKRRDGAISIWLNC